MLYLIATPLGNLADITLRAIDTLKSVDYILCEDTRHSRILLTHHGIKKPLKSYHKFNEEKELASILDDLKSGTDIALISDAGTPGISDPGHILLARCIQEKIPVTALPGPCAAVLALTLSGLSTERFQFVGFLPKKAKELNDWLQEVLSYKGTTIAYESPLRLKKTLELIATLDPERKIAVVREMTKKFEESLQGTAAELLTHFKTSPLKGEIVLLFAGEEKEEDFSHLSLREHVELLQKEYSLSLSDAIKTAARLRKLPKSRVYKEIHN